MEDVEDLDSAVDNALFSNTMKKMQGKLAKLEKTRNKIALRIRKKKTEVLQVNCSGKDKFKFTNGEDIKEATDFIQINSDEGGAGKDM